MSPAIKYTLGRIGLFLIVFAVLFPTPLNILVKAMIAFIASAAFSFILMRKWRDEMGEHLAQMSSRRSAEKARLRSALAGDDEAAEAGDRVTAADAKGAEPKGDDAAAAGSADTDAAAAAGELKAEEKAEQKSDTGN